MSSPARSKERDALLDTPDEMAVVGRKEGRYVCVWCVCVCGGGSNQSRVFPTKANLF